MGLVQSVASLVEPVSTADAKTYARIDTSDDDTLVGALVSAAREFVETFTGRQLITATWVYTREAFPSDRFLYLPRPLLRTVSSVGYYDANGTSQIMAASDYTVHLDCEPGYVELDYGLTWPTVQTGLSNAVTVTFTAGYGDAVGNVPQAIRTAIKLLVNHWYDTRTPVVVGTIQVDALLWPYRTFWSESP